MKIDITLRDWFAGQALAALLTHKAITQESAACLAFAYADAALAERAKHEAAQEDEADPPKQDEFEKKHGLEGGEARELLMRLMHLASDLP